MPARIARDAAISLLIFALVLAITRSDFTFATAVRPYVEAVLTRNTSLSEIGRTLRNAAAGLLAWNPWSQRLSGPGTGGGAGQGAAARTHEPPGGGADDAPDAPDIAEPAALSPLAPPVPADNKPEPTDSITPEARSVALSQAAIDQHVPSRGPTPTRAFSLSAGRVSLEPGAPDEDPAGSGSSEQPTDGAPGSAASGQKTPASRTTAGGSSPTHAGPSGGKLVTPVSGQVTYGFGYRVHPIYKRRLFHKGIDIAAPTGTLVRAAAAGRVLRAGPCGTYGRIVELDHAGGLTTLYAHCSRVLVKPGDMVRVGQKIAEVGSTGLSTGPHLHFEVSVGGKPVDPFAYLEGGRRERL